MRFFRTFVADNGWEKKYECGRQVVGKVETVRAPEGIWRAFALCLRFPDVRGVRAGGVLRLPRFGEAASRFCFSKERPSHEVPQVPVPAGQLCAACRHPSGGKYRGGGGGLPFGRLPAGRGGPRRAGRGGPGGGWNPAPGGGAGMPGRGCPARRMEGVGCRPVAGRLGLSHCRAIPFGGKPEGLGGSEAAGCRRGQFRPVRLRAGVLRPEQTAPALYRQFLNQG